QDLNQNWQLCSFKRTGETRTRGMLISVDQDQTQPRTIEFEFHPDVDSNPMGVNARGDVVGLVWLNNEQRAFLYRQGIALDLNSVLPPNSGWILRTATAINDRGQIAGMGELNGKS